MPRSLSDLRKVNLRSLIAQWGGPTNLGKKLGHKGPSYLAQLVSENRPITEKTARGIEGKLGLEPGWLDRENPGSPRPVHVDQSLVTKAVLAVGAALDEHGLQVKPAKFADLVALVYEEAAKTGVVEESFTQRIVRLLK